MDIEINKIINDPNGTLIKNGRISISDETILAIGKRYFELASGSAKPDSTRQLDNPTYFPVPVTDELLKEIKEKDTKSAGDVIEAAYIIKEYCSKRLCPGCPFSYLTTSSDMLCRCCLKENASPDKWQLPLREE